VESISPRRIVADEGPTATLEEVDILRELDTRPGRPPDYEAQHRALAALAEEMAVNPRNMLQRLVEVAVDLCKADTAGISVLDGEVFRWEAVAGVFAGARNGTMPRDASPCGVVIDRDAVQLMELPDRCFPALLAEPRFVETLLLPFHAHGRPLGTVWVVSHRPERRFDREDARILKLLTLYASPAWQLWQRAEEARASEAALQQAHNSLEARVRERTAEVQSLFSRLVSAPEDERRRIARDIHDQLGQQVTALRMHLEVLSSHLEQGSSVASEASRTQALAEDLDRSIDFLTWDLRPPVLDHLGLAAAIERLSTDWSERFGIAADVDVEDTRGLRLSPDKESNLYRLAQEAFHNVVKHAQATHVSLSLHRPGDELLFVLEDNGRGFVVDESQRRLGGAGLGLVSMNERAALIGGRLTIESEPGRGTTIFVRVPITAGDGVHDE